MDFLLPGEAVIAAEAAVAGLSQGGGSAGADTGDGPADGSSEVSFRWKNPDFLSRNPDFLSRNPDFRLKQC